MTKAFCAVFSTNKWFSAVNEYAWQLAAALHASPDFSVAIWAHKTSPLHEKAKTQALPTEVIDLLPAQTFQGSQKSFARKVFAPFDWARAVFLFQRNISNLSPQILFVFEGREHSLAAILKLLFPTSWAKTRLVRVRGQDSQMKNSILNRILYSRLTDKVVCVSETVKSRVPFFADDPSAVSLGQFEKCFVHPLCMDLNRFSNAALAPRKSPLTLSLIGRFDPVKGHELFFRVLGILMDDKETGINFPLRCFVVGRSENLSLSSLKETLTKFIPGKFLDSGRSPLSSNPNPVQFEDQKETLFQSSLAVGADSVPALEVWFADHRIASLETLHQQTHLGIIPSLGSEVICRVALEFMAAGVPCLSSKAGSLPEVIQEQGGWCFETGNPHAFASELKLALSEISESLRSSPERQVSVQQKLSSKTREKFGPEGFVELARKILSNQGENIGPRGGAPSMEV